MLEADIHWQACPVTWVRGMREHAGLTCGGLLSAGCQSSGADPVMRGRTGQTKRPLDPSGGAVFCILGGLEPPTIPFVRRALYPLSYRQMLDVVSLVS